MERTKFQRPGGGGHRSLIGLDIGSSAVRAIELAGSAQRPRVTAFAQIGLAPGVVIDGEIADADALVRALGRLWEEGGFTSRRVNVSVGGRRVVVREAEVTAMSADDFRTAMVFEAQDLVPIPTAEAVMDFAILGPANPSPGGTEQMRILLAAADRVGVQRLLDILKLANLEAVAVDVPQSALLRSIHRSHHLEGVMVVSVGSDLTNVVALSGARSFSRTLAVGASEVTRGVSLRLGVGDAEAEAVKRHAGGSDRGAQRAGMLVVQESGLLVEQVVESIDYFRGQGEGEGPVRVLLTGGGARTAGLAEQLASATGMSVELLDPFAGFDVSALPPDMVADARPVAAHVVGLATWPWESPTIRLTLLPPEILRAARQRQVVMGMVAAGLVLAVVLGGVWYGRHRQVGEVDHQAATVNAASTALQNSTAALSFVNSYFSAVDGRQQALSTLAGQLDWATLVGQIEAKLPPQLDLTGMQLSSTRDGHSPSSSSSASTGLGSVTLQLSGGTSQEIVASFLRAMAQVPALGDVLVPSSSTDNTGRTTFSATADITASAPRVTYPWESK